MSEPEIDLLGAAAEVAPPGQAPPSAGERIELAGRNLRQHTARGVVINSVFQIGFAGLAVLQRFAVAAFLTATEFGVWGLVLTTVVTLGWFKQIGISDKYVQQNEADQELAFQKAFTLELIYTLCFFVVMVTVLPLYALIYDRPGFLLPALVLALNLLISIFHTPLWIVYRQMRFVRQRVLEGLNPVVSTAVMVGLAIAGAGYWSLIAGILAGSVATAVAAVITSPYKLRLRFERGTLREYVRFSVPLLLASGCGLIVVQGTVLVGNEALGLAGLGAIVLAGSMIQFAQRVDALISRTIYPAVCTVADRTERLFEVFVKSNRLALMWALPFGVAMMLFGPDLVEFVLGSEWDAATPVIQVLGLMVGVGQVGANWSLFFNARGETRPVAVNGAVAVVAFVLVTVPLMIAFELDGYIVAVIVAMSADLVVRAIFLRRLFSGFSPLRHLVRAFLPSLPAAGVVLLARAFETGDRGLSAALGELGLYVAATAIATLIIERRLLAEVLGYLRGRPAGRAAGPVEVGA